MKKLFFIIVCFFSFILLTSCGESKVTVKFDSLGGTNVNSVEFVSGEKFSLPKNPTKEGFEFAGWYTSKDFKDDELFDDSKIVNEDITLFAKWNKFHDPVVTLRLNNGEADVNVVVSYGEKLVYTAFPQKEYCEFTGFYLDEDCTVSFNFESIITSDITLYAGYEGKTFPYSVEKPTSLVLFENNKKEKENKRTEFYDKTAKFLVGNNNPWKIKPNTTFVSYPTMEEVKVSSWEYVINIYLYENNNYTLLDSNNDFVESIDKINCLIKFTNNAADKDFKVEVYPTGLTIKQLSKLADYSISHEFTVVDGLNVYNASDFAYLVNMDYQYKNAWDKFKTENNLDLNLNPNSFILQNDITITNSDIPSEFFYNEGDSDLNANDSDFDRCLGSLRDDVSIYRHEVKDGETTTINGNYFKIDGSGISEIIRGLGKTTPEGSVISHTELFHFSGNNNGNAVLMNINMIGNAPRVDDVVKSGGYILFKSQGLEVKCYNNLAACNFITYFPNYSTTDFVIEKCKAYDAFNSFVYNWGSLLHIKDSEMIGAGGPVIIQDHVNATNQDGGMIARTFIENSKLESYVEGREGWFSVMNATAIVPQIKGLAQLFEPFGKTILKVNEKDNTISYLNFISLNKSGEAEGITATKIKGEVKIDDYQSFNFGEDNPYLAALLDNTFGKTAAFQSSENGLGYATEYGVFGLTNSLIADPTDPVYNGKYICVYYSGMSLLFEYFTVQQ